MRPSFLTIAAILTAVAFTAQGEDRATTTQRTISGLSATPDATAAGRFRIEPQGGVRPPAAAIPQRLAEPGPVAPIIVVAPADDAASELAMSLQAALQSEGFEVRATRNLDKTAGIGESGQPRWQEPMDAHLREAGAPEEIGSDASLYAQWLGAKALVRLQTSNGPAPVILYSQASQILAERIQRQLPGSLLVDCADCISSENFPEVIVDLGAGAAEPATRMAAATALAAGIKTLTADESRSAAKGTITSPASGTTLSGSAVTFEWTTGADATSYWLMVGTWLGGNTIYSQDQGTLTSAAVTGLPIDGRTIYVRLWSYINETWQSSDYTYRANSSGAATPVQAQITSPSTGSALPGATAAFQWSQGVAVLRYYLMVGLWQGGNTLYDADQGEGRQAVVNNLPLDGRTVYVRLWSYIDGAWQFQDTQYRATGASTPVMASMLSPAAGATLPGTTAVFQWSTGTGATRYYLFVGTWPGANNLFSQDMLTSQSATVANLPSDGSLIYARLFSYIDGDWQYNDTEYTASGTAPTPAKAQMTAPAANSTLSSGTVTFQWNAGIAVERYYLFVGTSLGNNDVYGTDQALNLTATVTSLPTNGKVLYVRLWSYIDSSWQYVDYSYRAAGQ